MILNFSLIIENENNEKETWYMRKNDYFGYKDFKSLIVKNHSGKNRAKDIKLLSAGVFNGNYNEVLIDLSDYSLKDLRNIYMTFSEIDKLCCYKSIDEILAYNEKFGIDICNSLSKATKQAEDMSTIYATNYQGWDELVMDDTPIRDMFFEWYRKEHNDNRSNEELCCKDNFYYSDFEDFVRETPEINKHYFIIDNNVEGYETGDYTIFSKE